MNEENENDDQIEEVEVVMISNDQNIDIIRNNKSHHRKLRSQQLGPLKKRLSGIVIEELEEIKESPKAAIEGVRDSLKSRQQNSKILHKYLD